MNRPPTLDDVRDELDYRENAGAPACWFEKMLWIVWTVILAAMMAHAIGGY